MLKRSDSVEDFERKQREKKTTDEQKVTKPVDNKVESRAERTDRETYIKRGQEAWARHKADATWYDWLAIGEAISYGRTEAMDEAKTNQPKGRGYNQAFGTWLIEHGFDDFDPSDRKRLFDVLEHRVEIEQWREKVLSGTERRRLNHPSTVWRKWKAYSETPQQKKEKAAKKQARIEAQEKQNEQQPTNLKDAIRKITDLEGQLDEANGARDGYMLTLDQHIDTVVDLLEGEPVEVIKQKVTALVSRLDLTLAEILAKKKKSGKSKSAKTDTSPLNWGEKEDNSTRAFEAVRGKQKWTVKLSGRVYDVTYIPDTEARDEVLGVAPWKSLGYSRSLEAAKKKAEKHATKSKK